MFINTKLIEDYMKENNLTKKQFAELCHFSTSTLQRILNGKESNYRYDVLRNLLLVLKVKSVDLIGF